MNETQPHRLGDEEYTPTGIIGLCVERYRHAEQTLSEASEVLQRAAKAAREADIAVHEAWSAVDVAKRELLSAICQRPSG